MVHSSFLVTKGVLFVNTHNLFESCVNETKMDLYGLYGKSVNITILYIVVVIGLQQSECCNIDNDN